MPAAGVVTLFLVLVTVAVLAASLVRVALLKHVNFTLGTVIAGVRAIELASRPINPVLGDIANDLAATQQALDGLVASKAAQPLKAPARAPSARSTPGSEPAP